MWTPLNVKQGRFSLSQGSMQDGVWGLLFCQYDGGTLKEAALVG